MRTASASDAPAAAQTAARLRRHWPACSAGRLADELAGLGIERDLARAEQQPRGADGVAVRADGRGGAEGGHGLAMLGHGGRLSSLGDRSAGRYRAATVRTDAPNGTAGSARCRRPSPPRRAVRQRRDRLRPVRRRLALQCGSLDVPLDRSGAIPGTVRLAAARRVAPSNPTSTAVVGLAGGPGQAALPLITDFATLLAPGARHARPADVRPARHRRLEPADLHAVGQLADRRRPALRDRASASGAASTRRPRASRTSRPCAPTAATRSSSSTASPTARRSRSTTPRAIPTASPA